MNGSCGIRLAIFGFIRCETGSDLHRLLKKARNEEFLRAAGDEASYGAPQAEPVVFCAGG